MILIGTSKRVINLWFLNTGKTIGIRKAKQTVDRRTPECETSKCMYYIGVFYVYVYVHKHMSYIAVMLCNIPELTDVSNIV